MAEGEITSEPKLPPTGASKAPESRVVRGLAGIVKSGLADYFRRRGGPVKEGESPTSGVVGWLKDKRNRVAGAVTESVGEAMSDEEVQTLGATYVSETIDETVKGIKSELPASLDEVADAITKDQEDTRNTYKKIRDIIGYDNNDKWYVKLGKSVAARIAAIGFPVLNFISAKVAGSVSEKESPEDIEKYKNSFDRIYNGLLTKLSPQT